jgi:hypothetical protein
LDSAVASAAPETAAIRWLTEGARAAVEVEGVALETLRTLESAAPNAIEWSRVLTVFAEQRQSVASEKKTFPAMAGVWRVATDRLRFEPQFPLVQGVRYRAEYRPTVGPPVISFFELPAEKAGPATSVVRVYPSADELPENQLKFYVEFSAPMSRGGTYEHVHVRDAAGRIIDLPFLELDEELWDLSMTRLTLLIDPGRIKRGVKPLEDIGPVFEAGKAYALTLEAECRDAAGRPLRAKFEKKFRIGPPDRSPPDPRRWTIQSPAAGTRAPLVVNFDEAMDQALALRLIEVAAGESGKTMISGDATLARNERGWTFVPTEPWPRGPHRLTVATTIEDLAGNNIGKTFDVDLASGAQRRVTSESVSVGFEVK